MSYSNYQLNQRINNLQSQINNLEPSGGGNLQETLNLGNVANNSGSNIGSINLTSVPVEIGIPSSVLTIDGENLTLTRNELDSDNFTATLNRTYLSIKSEDQTDPNQFQECDITNNSISTTYNFGVKTAGGASLNSVGGTTPDQTYFGEGILNIGYTEASVADGEITKKCSLEMKFDADTSSFGFTTLDAISEDTVPILFKQNIALSEGKQINIPNGDVSQYLGLNTYIGDGVSVSANETIVAGDITDFTGLNIQGFNTSRIDNRSDPKTSFGTSIIPTATTITNLQGDPLSSAVLSTTNITGSSVLVKYEDIASSVVSPICSCEMTNSFLTFTKGADVLEFGNNTISINGNYGTAGQVLTSGSETGTLSWTDNTGTTPDLNAVLTEGNESTEDIVLRVNPTDEDGNKATFSASSGSYLTYDNFVVVNETLADSGKIQITTGNPTTTGSQNLIQSDLILVKNATQNTQINPNTIMILNGNPIANRNVISIDSVNSLIQIENIQTGIDKINILGPNGLSIANNIADEVSTLSTTNLSIISGDLNASFSEVSLDSSTNTILTKQQGVGIVRQTEITNNAVQVYESLGLGQENYISIEPKQIGIGVDGTLSYGDVGQVLTSGGASGVLSWTTPSGTPSLADVLAVAPSGKATADLSITFKETQSPFLTTRFDIDGINSTRPSIELQNDTLINIGTDNNGPNTITIGHNILPTSNFSPLNLNGKVSINGVLFSGADAGSPQIGIASFTIPQDALRNSLYTLIISGTANPTPVNFPTDDTGGKYITIFNGGNQSLRCQCSAVPTRPFVGGNNGLSGATTYAIRPNQTVQFLSAGAQGFLLFAQSNPNSNVGNYPFPIQSLTTNQRVIATRITGASVNGTFTYTSIAGQQPFNSIPAVVCTAEDATGNHTITLRTSTTTGFTYVSSGAGFPTAMSFYALGV
jgi:hypothetical protein